MKYVFITAEEFGHAIVLAPKNTVFDFTFDQSEEDFSHKEPQGWHGAKIITIFDESEGVLCVGYYGGGTTFTRDVYGDYSGNNIDHCIEEDLEDYASCESVRGCKFCVEVTEENKEYLERAIEMTAQEA